jgi:hypothetical protein
MTGTALDAQRFISGKVVHTTSPRPDEIGAALFAVEKGP